MADVIDMATRQSEMALENAIRQIRQSAQIPAGVQGECEECGEHSLRLINRTCSPCRDRLQRRTP